MILSL
jgi:hypothetical protein